MEHHSQATWARVDEYLGVLAPVAPRFDEALADVLTRSQSSGLPEIHVAPNQGKLLWLLAKAIGARRILEVGTLGGYSTIWLASALPRHGRVITIEVDPRRAEVARLNLTHAGVADRVDVIVGDAHDVLGGLVPPFDLTFIDADKAGYPRYFDHAVRLSRPGGIIIADNVVRDGAVLDAASSDPSVRGVQEFLRAAANDPRVDATAIQTVGVKGYDGLAFALVR